MKPISKENKANYLANFKTKAPNILPNTNQTAKIEDIKGKINTIFQPLISEILIKQPLDEKEIYKYLINYLIKMKGEKVDDSAFKEYVTLKRRKLDDLDEDFFVDINEQNNLIDMQTLRSKIAKKKPKVDYSEKSYGIFAKEPDNLYDFKLIMSLNKENLDLIKEKLKEFFFFKTFTEVEIKNIAENFKYVNIYKNQKLFSDKYINNPNILLIVVKGNLNVYRDDKLIQIINEEELYADLFIPYPRQNKIEIVADMNSTLFYITHEKVMQINKEESRKKFDIFKRLMNSSDYFRNECSGNDIVKLYQFSEIVNFKKNDYIIRKGDQVDGIFIIGKGVVSCISMDGNLHMTLRESAIIGVPTSKSFTSLDDYRVVSNECKLFKIKGEILEQFKEKDKVYFQFN